MKPIAAFMWRKLDHPGHDGCRLFKLAGGWRLAGIAVFREAGRPCHLQYDVTVDTAWRTRRADVAGYLGNKAIDVHIRVAGHGRWRVNGEARNRVAGCIDVDLGFTPATNMIVLRRLSLRIGQRAEAPAAYLDFPRMRLVKLRQAYHRIGRRTYEYEAPTAGYAGTLHVSPSGAIVRYPGLFERVGSG